MELSVLQTLVEKGHSQREIASILDLSQTTIRYWMQRYELKSQRPKHPPVTHDSPRFIERSCHRHGLTTYVLEPSHGYRCKRCRSDKVSRDRRNLKVRLVTEAGGQCVYCKYSRSYWSMHFHHRDPSEKERDIGHLIRDRKYAAAKTEVAKCDLVCANCHGELEEAKWRDI
jgi:hypothetical protein